MNAFTIPQKLRTSHASCWRELHQGAAQSAQEGQINSADKTGAALTFIRAQKHKAWFIGEVVKGKGKARVV